MSNFRGLDVIISELKDTMGTVCGIELIMEGRDLLRGHYLLLLSNPDITTLRSSSSFQLLAIAPPLLRLHTADIDFSPILQKSFLIISARSH
jgi:hypothetical protein